MTDTLTLNEQIAMSMRKIIASLPVGRTPPRQPDYRDELTSEQIEAIRKLSDPDGSKAAKRTVLHAPAW